MNENLLPLWALTQENGKVYRRWCEFGEVIKLNFAWAKSFISDPALRLSRAINTMCQQREEWKCWKRRTFSISWLVPLQGFFFVSSSGDLLLTYGSIVPFGLFVWLSRSFSSATFQRLSLSLNLETPFELDILLLERATHHLHHRCGVEFSAHGLLNVFTEDFHFRGLFAYSRTSHEDTSLLLQFGICFA